MTRADKDIVAEWRAEHGPAPDAASTVFLLRAAEEEVQDIRRDVERAARADKTN
ncbi:MAG: hypothetical protein ACON4Z_08395 [Planctomycetota bacterium]